LEEKCRALGCRDSFHLYLSKQRYFFVGYNRPDRLYLGYDAVIRDGDMLVETEEEFLNALRLSLL